MSEPADTDFLICKYGNICKFYVLLSGMFKCFKISAKCIYRSEIMMNPIQQRQLWMWNTIDFIAV